MNGQSTPQVKLRPSNCRGGGYLFYLVWKKV